MDRSNEPGLGTPEYGEARINCYRLHVACLGREPHCMIFGQSCSRGLQGGDLSWQLMHQNVNETSQKTQHAGNRRMGSAIDVRIMMPLVL